MKFTVTRLTLLSVGLAGGLIAAPEGTANAGTRAPSIEIDSSHKHAAKDKNHEHQHGSEAAKEKKGKDEKKPVVDPAKKEKLDRAAKAQELMKKEQERLALENSLADEKFKKETHKLRNQIARLKIEKELMTERLAHAAAERAVDEEAKNAKLKAESRRLARQAELEKARAELLASELKSAQAEAGIKIAKLQGQIQEIETEQKRKDYASGQPEYLKNPLKKDGTLVISDRRIALNGPIGSGTADHITDRIHYFNNQNEEQPIFIVIDECPGGSVMAGYRILKSMEASEAPIHVVVKSFAASMAAAITTLAEESYAYPNAVILHHQISATVFGRLNLTQQAEFLKESNRWWDRLATPIADKMGLTKEEFIKKMYEQSTSGDWSEFGVEAQKLSWVKHIVNGVDETSFRQNPDAKSAKEKSAAQRSAFQESIDEEGRPVMYLPRINSKDVYFLYNPDGYYRVR
ncbi:ATP-dependent Clp protease proteolytic subunit [Haloferula chungangensis]|uniref:ATP-dependent Clp protease proteolytic subunit n=1 Tax=Haloferula chungangensis TaxID=1048331 RepID=A0ABW2L3C6_9BACT